MPSFSSILTLSMVIISALAAPATQLLTARHYNNSSRNHTAPWHRPQQRKCLTDSEAQLLATKYGLLISNYTDSLADEFLTTNFTDHSESVNTLINSCPQGSAAHLLPSLEVPTFNSLEQFKMGQAQQPAINFEQLAIWTSCRSVTIRWRTTNTVNETDLLPTAKEGVRPVIGLITMEVSEDVASSSGIGWKIHTVYSEFNAGAWLQNLMDANICHNPEKNLGAPPVPGAEATPSSGTGATPATAVMSTGSMAAVVPSGASMVQEAPVAATGAAAAAAAPTKRARMYI